MGIGKKRFRIRQFFSGIRVHTKVYIGFGAVLSLLIGLGASSWLSSQESNDNISAYTEQSKIALLSARADTALLRALLAVSQFHALGTSADIDAFRTAVGALETHITDAKQAMAMDESRKTAEDILMLVEEYTAAFDQLVALRERDNRLTETVLNETGVRIRRLISDLRDAEASRGSLDTHVVAAGLDSQVLLARTVAARFVESRNPEDRTKVRDMLRTVQSYRFGFVFHLP